MAETRADAVSAFNAFIASYELKYEKAADCLAKDREALLAFYDFPAEHWKHLRTSNPIESTFATVRHRTIRYTSDRSGLPPILFGSCQDISKAPIKCLFRFRSR